MTILDQLADYTRIRTTQAKEQISLNTLKDMAYALPKGTFTFENALKKPDISFICECKKASPSKGLIAPDFPYLRLQKTMNLLVLTVSRFSLNQNGFWEVICI